jgi:hypothetical protein
MATNVLHRDAMFGGLVVLIQLYGLVKPRPIPWCFELSGISLCVAV